MKVLGVNRWERQERLFCGKSQYILQVKKNIEVLEAEFLRAGTSWGQPEADAIERELIRKGKVVDTPIVLSKDIV